MLALAGGTVYTEPSARPISDGVVVVDQSRIVSVGARDEAAIPSNARVLDCTDLTVAAGFWFDLGSVWPNTRAIRDRIATGEVNGPAIYSAGEIVVPPGAMPPENVLRVLGVMPQAHHEASDAREGTGAATAIISQGTDALKVFMSGNASDTAKRKPWCAHSKTPPSNSCARGTLRDARCYSAPITEPSAPIRPASLR